MIRSSPETTLALGSATLMIANQVAGKATRDAIFLSQHDVTELPKMVLVSAIASIVAVIFMARLLTRFGPSRVIPLAFAGSAVLFVGNWWLYDTAADKVAILLYLQIAIFGAVLISGFWSVVNERFDPHTAKQTIARVAAAATLGGVLGGLIAGRVAAAADTRAMLLVLGVIHLACFFTVRGIGESKRSPTHSETLAMQSGFRLLASEHYLQKMAALMVLVAILAALIDYAFKSAASSRLSGSEDLVVFFGQFYATIGVLTFLVQSVLGPRMLKVYGIGIVLAVMPAIALGAGVLSMMVVKFWSIVLLRGGQMVFTNSFFRSSFELLYTPLPPTKKRPTKTIIDVASDRLGDVIGSGLLIGILALIPAVPLSYVIGLAMLFAVAALLLVRQLYRGYVGQLASSLRDGAISLSDDDVVDATTRHTLAEATAASERELLMRKIRDLKYERAGVDRVADSEVAPRAVAGLDPDAQRLIDTHVISIADLLSGDDARILRCLSGEFMDQRLIPYMIPLLANDMVAEDVRMELRWMAPRSIGLLTDALLDPDIPLPARQRIPSVLEVTHNPRAIRALIDGLSDDEFNVRYSCGRALARMNERDRHMKVKVSTVFKVVEAEVAVDKATWESRDLQVDVDLPVDMATASAGGDPRIDYSLEHVFNLLSLVLDPDALMLSRKAVFSTDRNLRGTALEYLENVLPENVRRGLWPRFGQAVSSKRARRSDRVLIDELRGAVD